MENQEENKFSFSLEKNSDFSDEEEYISENDLVDELEQLISKIKKGNCDDVTRQDIHDSIEEYLTGKNKSLPLDKETLSYLFTGWWVKDSLRRISNPDVKPGEKLPPLAMCPYCLKTMNSEVEKNIET